MPLASIIPATFIAFLLALIMTSVTSGLKEKKNPNVYLLDKFRD